MLTLASLWKNSPENEGEHERLCAHFGIDPEDGRTDQTAFPASDITKVLNLGECLGMMDRRINRDLCKLFAIDCAETCVSFVEEAFGNNGEANLLLNIARDPHSTKDQHMAAYRRTMGLEFGIIRSDEVPYQSRLAAISLINAIHAAAEMGVASGFARRGADAAAKALSFDGPQSKEDIQSLQLKRLGQYLDFGAKAKFLTWPDAVEPAEEECSSPTM